VRTGVLVFGTSLEYRNGELRETVVDRDRVIAALRAHEGKLHGFGVARLYLFGSVARAYEKGTE